jgi:hypothetical protein
MGLAAVVFIVIAVLVGTIVLADLAPGPGLRRVAGTHVTIALLAAVLVCVAAFAGGAPVAWLAVAAVAAAVSLGVVTWRRSLGGPTRVSAGLLIAHGAAAGLTLLFALLLAAGR